MTTPPQQNTQPPLGLRTIARWSENSLEPAAYWGDRYPDVVHERVDGFLSGFIVGVVLTSLVVVVLAAVVAT